MIAAVRLVLPWSMWPIVPTLTCGLVRSNFFLAMSSWTPCSSLATGASRPCLDLRLGDELGREARGNLGVVARTPSSSSPGPGSSTAGPWRSRTSRPAARTRGPPGCVPRVSMPSIWPRRLLRSPMTSPMNSSGIVTSTRIIGSRTTGFAFATASLMRHRAGDLERHLRRVDLVVRAVEERHLDVDHRVARRRCPSSSASRMPASIGLMYSRGIVPPTILSTNS